MLDDTNKEKGARPLELLDFFYTQAEAEHFVHLRVCMEMLVDEQMILETYEVTGPEYAAERSRYPIVPYYK